MSCWALMMLHWVCRDITSQFLQLLFSIWKSITLKINNMIIFQLQPLFTVNRASAKYRGLLSSCSKAEKYSSGSSIWSMRELKSIFGKELLSKIIIIIVSFQSDKKGGKRRVTIPINIECAKYLISILTISVWPMINKIIKHRPISRKFYQIYNLLWYSHKMCDLFDLA